MGDCEVHTTTSSSISPPSSTSKSSPSPHHRLRQAPLQDKCVMVRRCVAIIHSQCDARFLRARWIRYLALLSGWTTRSVASSLSHPTPSSPTVKRRLYTTSHGGLPYSLSHGLPFLEASDVQFSFTQIFKQRTRDTQTLVSTRRLRIASFPTAREVFHRFRGKIRCAPFRS